VPFPKIPGGFPAQGVTALERVEKAKAADQRLRVKRATGEQMLSVGETTYRGYERTGEVEVVVDHGQVWTLTGSIYDKMGRDIIKSYAAGGMPSAADPRKNVIPKKAKKLKRQLSPAQREALDRENQRRSEAKAAREAEASM
jgi:hypothetical protein